jgi:hypothetical protein
MSRVHLEGIKPLMNDLDVTITVAFRTSVSALPFVFQQLQQMAAPPDAPPTTSAPPAAPAPGGTAPATLNEAQGRLFVEPCAPKTLSVLRAIVDGRPHPFSLSKLAQDLGVGISDLAWVWGGLTKRVHNVLADPNARLITWQSHPKDATGKWVDSDGTMAETTIASLRKALNIIIPAPVA